MIREYYEAICNGVDVRANLIALRNALKDEKEIRAFAYLLGGDFSVLGSLLVHEDPKVRKNAAILLGKMESEDMLPLLFETYQKEETRFIRADYLKAMEHMDYAPYLGKLQERLQESAQCAGGAGGAEAYVGGDPDAADDGAEVPEAGGTPLYSNGSGRGCDPGHK